MMVNNYQLEEGMTTVGQSAVMFIFHKLKPIITRIKKKSQGNKDHAKLAISQIFSNKANEYMLGRISKDTLMIEHINNLPGCFNPELLYTLTCTQIIYFDEMHIEQEGGPLAHNGIQIRFPRTNGVYDPNSTLITPETFEATYKYNQRVRFWLGVAKVQLLNGEIKGRRCDVFDYTCKRMLTIEEYAKKIKDEIK